MNFRDIEKSRLHPIVVLDTILSHRGRHIVSRINSIILVGFFFVLMVVVVGNVYGAWNHQNAVILNTITPKLFGLALIALGIWLVVFLQEAFFRAYYFENVAGIKGDLVRGNDTGEEWDRITFEALHILLRARNEDLWRAFFSSPLGARVCLRAGISPSDARTFSAGRPIRALGEFEIPPGEVLTAAKLAALLYDRDETFVQFLFERNLKREEWIAASAWVADEYAREKERERWWTRERLSRVPSMGADFSYGEAYALRRYATDLTETAVSVSGEEDVKQNSALVDLERVLLREKGQNALVVAPIASVATDLLRSLARRISNGTVPPALEHKRLYLLSPETIVAAAGEKAAFEQLFITMMNQAVVAGNSIIAFERIHAFSESVRPLGVNLMELLEPYLVSSRMQIIATADHNEFREILEPNAALMAHFSVVKITETESDETIRILENIAEGIEARHGVFFTYPAIAETVRAAEEYFSEGIMPDKAIDLLTELVPLAKAEKTGIITRSLVHALVERKTKIPMGEVTAPERDKLMQLEPLLHKRVIGQDEAVVAIAGAIRRARAGVRSEKRPIGNFLFLGPTGVGKTETAKALAEVFFGNEDALSRLDMTEYRTGDSLARLIGSFEGHESGTLSSMLREKPYGVVLLDEFEKTAPEALDLFLQVFDEGMFADMRGRKVSARQSIFIATSNAGSDLIWEKIKSGAPLANAKDEIITEIVGRGIFKPELLNRFDGVILFTPLDEEARRRIGRLMLEQFAKGMREKGIDVVITDALVEYVAAQGNDPAFGARPMRRAIQETVERIVAEKIIAGALPPGSRLELSPEDLPH